LSIGSQGFRGGTMPDTTTRQLGQLALDRGLVDAGQLREAVDEFKRRKVAGSRMPLGEVMVEMGYLTRPQLEQLLGAQGGRKSPRQIIPGFELVRKLGEGGMGATYLARQESMERLVALKVLRKSLSRDEQFVARFRREAQLAGRLDHVNIVQAIDVGEAAGFHYLIMEYVEGRNLGDMMPESGPMSEELALHVVIQMSRALEFAQQHGIIHRDIKPDNILVTSERVAKLCDFGLARQDGGDGTRLTQTGTAMGTPHYVSPEQARGDRSVDIRSDIYSLGATLYHLVTGQTPFSGSSAVIVMTKHLTEQLPWPQDINPELSMATSQVIARMMAKNPADRYQTPRELAVALERAIDGEAPGEHGLAPGQSSVATRGTIPITVEPPDARPRRYRETRFEPAAGTDPTMPLGRLPGGAQAASGNLKLMVGGAVAIAALVLAFIAWLVVTGRKGGGPRGRSESSTGAGTDTNAKPPVAPVKPPGATDGKKEAEEMFAYAGKWWREHPAEYAEARRKFESLRGKADGVLGMKVEDAIREIDKARGKRVAALLAPLQKQARMMADIGDFDGAVGLLEAAPEKTRNVAKAEILAIRAELVRKAEARLAPIMADAERLSRDGRPKAALKRLKDLRGARYAPITGRLAALEARLESEVKDTAALESKREKAQARKEWETLFAAMDAELARGDHHRANDILERRKKGLSTATKKYFGKELSAITSILKELRLSDEHHEKTVAGLVDRQVRIKTRRGTTYDCRIKKFDEEHRTLELERTYRIGGNVKTSRREIAFDDLAEGEIDKLLKPREPQNSDAWMAMAIMAIHSGDVGFAPEPLKNAGNHVFLDYYRKKLGEARKRSGEDRARWEWEHEVLPKVRKSYTKRQASELVGQLEAWLRENDATRFHAEHLKEARQILRVARAAGGVGGEEPGPGDGEVPENVTKFFKGKVTGFDQRDLEVEIHWDFSDRKQLEDFSVLGGKWKIEKGALVGSADRRTPDSRLQIKALFEDQVHVQVIGGVRRGKQAYIQMGSDRDYVQMGMDFLGFGGRDHQKAILSRNSGEWKNLVNMPMARLRRSATCEMMMDYGKDRSLTATLSGKKLGKVEGTPDKQVRIWLGLLHSFDRKGTQVVFEKLRVRARFDRPWFQRTIEAGGEDPQVNPEKHFPRPREDRPGPGGHRPRPGKLRKPPW